MKCWMLLVVLGAVAGCHSSVRVSEPEATDGRSRLDGAAAERLESLIGQTVRVQFRRDALGVSATAPIAPTRERMGTRELFLDGTLTAVSSEWIAIQTEKDIHWIPREGVLLIEVAR